MSRPFGFKHTEDTKSKMRGHAAWNKGLSKETHISVYKQSKSLTKHWKDNPHPNLGKSGRILSAETKHKMSLGRIGSKNANWKGGFTELVKGIRRSPEYHQWRKTIKEQASNKCQECGSGLQLHAHHIESIIEHPELVFEVQNGILLCESCHKRLNNWQRLNSYGLLKRMVVKCKKRP